MLIGLPAVYLAFWTFAIPAFPVIRARYYYWMHPYLWLLSLAIAVEILVLVVPMWRFHLDMAAGKLLLPEPSRRVPEPERVLRELCELICLYILEQKSS